MSVIARCAATPSTCDSAKEVTAWTMVAAPAASASGISRSARPLPMTSSIRYLEVAGRTRPTSRLTSMSARPSAEPPLAREDQRARFAPGGLRPIIFFFGVLEGSTARPASDRRPRAASDRGIRNPPLNPPGMCSTRSTALRFAATHLEYDASARTNVSIALATPPRRWSRSRPSRAPFRSSMRVPHDDRRAGELQHLEVVQVVPNRP